ncbi:MAG: nuclear transport factor 2 family protein [Chloroflexia bacterium]
MTTATSKTTSEAEIRELVNNRVASVHTKDIDKVMADHAPDILLFDALVPLQYTGVEEARKRTAEWFGWYDGPIGYEIAELNIKAGEDVAFCSYLYHVTGTMTNGNKVDMWVRTTLGCERSGGEWRVTHEHNSVPFDAETGKAGLDLKP